MADLHNLIIKVKEDGYDDENAEAKVSQDIFDMYYLSSVMDDQNLFR